MWFQTNLDYSYLLSNCDVTFVVTVYTEKSYTLSVEIELKFRNPIWNPKMIQDPIKVFHKYPYTLKLITSPDLHRLVQIIYDVIAITSAHSEWLLFLTNLWSGTKVIFLSGIIATYHCMVCTCDIVTLYIFCVHLSLQRMWFVDCSCEYFSCVLIQINNSNEIQKSTLESRYPNLKSEIHVKYRGFRNLVHQDAAWWIPHCSVGDLKQRRLKLKHAWLLTCTCGLYS